MNCKIGSISLLGIIFAIISTSAYSQEENHNHDHHMYEIGVANSCVFFVGEKEFAYGLHIHLVRNIKHSKFGYGIAYERIFDEHKHNTVGIVGSYVPFKTMHLNIAPGIAFEDSEPSDFKFSFHAETSYDFNLGNFHIGPLLEFAFDAEDYHISLGLHIGYGF